MSLVLFTVGRAEQLGGDFFKNHKFGFLEKEKERDFQKVIHFHKLQMFARAALEEAENTFKENV